MRMMMKVLIPVETGNKAIREGLLQKVVQEITGKIRPEAAYFTTEKGRRCSYFFFDMKDSSQMPQFGEPAFMGLNAEIEFQPVMNQDDLVRGLEAWAKQGH